MRLIDADKVIEHLEKVIKDNPHFVNAAYIRGIQEVIKEQPTAYDVDKVVGQLEDYGNEETCYYKNTPYERCIEECIGKALEIVKVGGNINE